MCPQFEYYERVALKGYFKYKDYIFIWYGDIPQYLGDVSNKEKKIPYVSQPSYMKTETTEFYFNYTFKNDLDQVSAVCNITLESNTIRKYEREDIL